MEKEITIKVKIDLEQINGFDDIAKQVANQELNRSAFIKCVEILDEKMTEELAGEKYLRAKNMNYSRNGTTPFSILIDFGRIDLNLNRVKSEDTEDQPKYKTVIE